MTLDLREIIQNPGSELPFSYTLNVSEYEPEGAETVPDGALAEGVVRCDEAGVLTLSCCVTGTLHLICDRCLKEFTREHECQIESLVAESLEDENNDDIIQLREGIFLDLDDLLRDEFILSLPTVNLCAPDCKGLCPKCGADLNLGPCGCKKEVDPRLEGLAEYFKKHPKK